MPDIAFGEHAMDRRLVEARVHQERHELHSVRARLVDDAVIDTSPDHSVFIEREHLWRDDRDLVRVREETLDAQFAAGVPERFGLLRGGRMGGGEEDADPHRVTEPTPAPLLGHHPSDPTAGYSAARRTEPNDLRESAALQLPPLHTLRIWSRRTMAKRVEAPRPGACGGEEKTGEREEHRGL